MHSADNLTSPPVTPKRAKRGLAPVLPSTPGVLASFDVISVVTHDLSWQDVCAAL